MLVLFAHFSGSLARLCRILPLLAIIFASSAAQAEKIELLENSALDTKAFAFTGGQGEHLTLHDYHGQWVVVNFWATWCPPCVAELPSLDMFQKRYAEQGLVVLPLSQGREEITQLNRFLSELGVTHLTAYKDEGSKAFRLAKGRGLPTSLVISPKGKLIARIQGEIDWVDEATLSRFDGWLGVQDEQ